MTTTHSRYGAHLRELRRRYDEALDATGFDAVVIGAGEPVPVFRDDQHHPYRAEPLLLQWLPLDTHPGSCLVHRPGRRPLLLVIEADDYWHQAAPVPAGPWQRLMDIRILRDRRAIGRHLPRSARRIALLGDPAQWRGLPWAGSRSHARNPRPLLNRLDHARARKTDWEVACLLAATARAVAGHRAVRDAFADGLSEFELGLVFLAASGQTDAELPYPAIVASNRNAATLHYQHRDRTRHRARDRHSLLIDAGCSFGGYASDITRSYAARRGAFADLVRAADEAQQALCRMVRPGVPFPELQLAAHRAVAELLYGAGLIRMAPEKAVAARITDAFFPHGLGHLLGLQVHDVGGGMARPTGGELPRPARFPRLRLTRTLEPGMVVTIEPGLYLIDSLLARLRRSRHARQINWRAVDALRPCGGIRIEDDVLVTAGGHENLTRRLSNGD